MKIAIVVSGLQEGSGLSKYIISLVKILAVAQTEIMVVTTHESQANYCQRVSEINKDCTVKQLGGRGKIGKYIGVLKTLWQFSPDILINNYNGLCQFLLPLLSRKIKTIHVLHNDRDDFYRIGAINARYVDGWIAPTHGIAEKFNSYTHQKYKDRVTVIPHGVESHETKPHADTEKLEIVFVGVLSHHKGVLLFPDIIEELIKRNVDFHFAIIGGGTEEQNLKSKLKYYMNDGLVTMTGVVTPDEVYQKLSKSDVFLYPTHTDAFGLVIAEAMMNGVVPVVTSLKGITDNLVDDSQNGYLLERDDVSGFVDRICLLYNDREKLRCMKLEAKKKAKNEFSLDKMRENYVRYLQQLKSSR